MLCFVIFSNCKSLQMIFGFLQLIIQIKIFPLPPQRHTEDLAGTPESHTRSPCARASAYDSCHAIHLVTSLQ